MKNIIERIHQRTTEYSHPSQATTTANALDLLSSGIYTEEERFIFELLQNAVDSYDAQHQTNLSIKIVLADNLLIFMHNGTPFSEKDLESLCDIGNGNKMRDPGKIGYKGIGFKSVFMHSHRVSILTNGICFKFDKEACEAIAKSKGAEYKDVKMPWQIIPILADVPSDIKTDGFNVITYIETSNRKSLKRKVEKLLNDTRFLLFLKVEDLNISFWNEGEEVLNLSKKQTDDILTLSKNGESQTNWLIHSTEVKLTSEVKDALVHDSKTPTKLKESESVEISFAAALDKDKNIIPIKNALMYTYLPTSFSFGLNFIVNANFITDAGRQQIVKDCAWNEFIFTQIPGCYLKWIEEKVAEKYSDWFKVLPVRTNNDDELSEAYAKALTKALETIPFVKTIKCENLLLNEALVDNVGLVSAIPNEIFDTFVQTEVSKDVSINTLVSLEVGKTLQTIYGIANVSPSHVHTILEKANDYLEDFSDEEALVFLSWLKALSQDYGIDFKNAVSCMSILYDDDNNLIEPVSSFFPSDYSDENPDISADAKIIRKSLAELFTDDLMDWLKELGVQEMSNLSVIEKVLCERNYVISENAIKVLRFIFECNKKENIFKHIDKNRLSNLKVLTISKTLKNASELYLSNIYNPICKIQDTYSGDIFVSDEYPINNTECAEWSLFLRKLGCKDDIGLSLVQYDEMSWVMQSPEIRACVLRAKRTEYNTSYWGDKYYLGCAGGICVWAMSSPLIADDVATQMHDFYIQFWSRIFAKAVPNKKADYIFGKTGCGYTKSAILSESSYLGQSFLEWFVNYKKILPSTDGRMLFAKELLVNSEYNKKTFGSYFPVLAIKEELTKEWTERLSFKKELSLSEYLDVLSRISEDKIKEQISENKDRINRIYERISDTFDFSEGSSNFREARNWGQSHKILSKEGSFESPESLYLLSSNLSGVELENQVFHGKHLENDRFASFMIALGVNMITNYHVEGLENVKRASEINDILVQKESFLTSVAKGDSFTEKAWQEARTEMHDAITSLEFYQSDSICLCFGRQKFTKSTYAKGKKFYFVDKFGLANQELLHGTIMDALDIPRKIRTIFLTILQMNDFSELKEYIEQKGYDASFVEEPKEMLPEKTQTVVIGGENPSLGGLTQAEMRNALEEAKETILQKLSNDGFDISKKVWDGWTCIDGITKEGIEYPLVIRSNKSQRNTCLSPSDWNQLMKPNAMFAVVTSNGIGTISLREILKSKEKISIKFSSDNIDDFKHTRELAQVFTYFKGIQFDFESYINPVINQWERFLAPELSTGELPQSASPFALPE